MSTALAKLWAKDLAPAIVAMATAKAIEATKSWNGSVTGILAAARAVYEVQAKIGGAPVGAFGKWAEEELKRSPSTAGQLAKIGKFYNELYNARHRLPPAWGTLYDLVSAHDETFRRALRRMTPDMERGEVDCLLAEETEQPAPKKASRKKKETRVLPSPSESQPEPGPRAAALTTIEAGSLWRTVKDFEIGLGTALQSLSPEARAFIVTNHLRPSQELIEEMIGKLLTDKATV